MKKIISILLTVLMLAGCFVALVPTATAAAPDASIVPAVTKGELVYSENFESEALYTKEMIAPEEGGDPVETAVTLKEDALLAALGWSGTLNFNEDPVTQSTRNSATLVKEEIAGDTPTYNHKLFLKALDNDLALTFVDNALLAGGDYIIEFTQTVVSNDGNDSRATGILTGGDASADSCNDTVIHAMLQEKGNSTIDIGFPSQAIDDLETAEKDIATGKTRIKKANGTNVQRNNGSIYNKEYRYTIVVDNEFGVSMYYTDLKKGTTTLFAYSVMQQEGIGAANWTRLAAMIESDVAYNIMKGLCVELDDFQVYTIQRETEKYPGAANFAPGLIISEFMTMGTANQEWIEVYNAGDVAVNVYDYAIAREAGASIKNLYTGTVAEDEICYIYPDEKTIGANTFTNPAYADGVLLPGDAAILFIPGASTATVETFKELDLKGVYGMTDAEIAALKIFTICSEHNFTNNDTGNDLFAVTPVVNGVAKVLGQNITNRDCVESLSADVKGGKNAYLAFEGVNSGGYTPKEYCSNEVIWFDADRNFSGRAVMDQTFSPNNKSLSDTPCTPGYIRTAHAKKLHSVTLTGMILEEDYVDTVYMNIEYVPTLVPQSTKTQKFAGWLDAEGNVIQSLAAVRTKGEDLVLVAYYETVIPKLAGYQVTETVAGKYDLRIVATVDNLDSVAFGMRVAFKYNDGEKDVYGAKEYFCRYIYEEISTDYGTGTVSAETYNAEYIVAFHIEGCHADVEMEYTITTFAVFQDADGGRSTEWDNNAMIFTLPA